MYDSMVIAVNRRYRISVWSVIYSGRRSGYEFGNPDMPFFISFCLISLSYSSGKLQEEANHLLCSHFLIADPDTVLSVDQYRMDCDV